MEDPKQSQGGGPDQPNPPAGEPNPAPKEQPQTPGTPKENPKPSNDDAFKRLEEENRKLRQKVEELTRQYKGSTEEALRLKRQLEEKENERRQSFDEDSFQRLIDEKGLKGALETFLSEKISPLEKTLESLVQDRTAEVIMRFIETHPELKDPEVLERFNQELSSLKKAYSNPDEAMEKAFYLATAGRNQKSEDVPQTGDEKKLVSNVSGADRDTRPEPPQSSDSNESILKKINDLEYEAQLAFVNGRPTLGTQLLAKADELRATLGSKV